MIKEANNKQPIYHHRSDYIKSFSRRSSIDHYYKNLFSKYTISCSEEHTKNLFLKEDIVLDIGFGYGEHTLKYAIENPLHTIIGCEPYLKGVSYLLKKIKDHQVNNILIWPDDVRLLIANIPDNILQDILILFPDPWPKRAHHKRRLINSTFLKLISQKTKPTGIITIATDHQEYCNWIIKVIQDLNFLSYNVINNVNNFPNITLTRYYKKSSKQFISIIVCKHPTV